MICFYCGLLVTRIGMTFGKASSFRAPNKRIKGDALTRAPYTRR